MADIGEMKIKFEDFEFFSFAPEEKEKKFWELMEKLRLEGIFGHEAAHLALGLVTEMWKVDKVKL